MISDYMEDLEIINPFSHLKPWQKTPYEKAHGKNIYKNSNGRYFIEKTINKETIRQGTYDTFQEALEARDELIRNGWVKIPSVEEKQRKYYANIYMKSQHYFISKDSNFYGTVGTIEEAVYYKDICKKHNWTNVPKPKELDLKTDNPYLNDGLDYPVPKRLIMPPVAPKMRGSITRNSEQSYRVNMGQEYYGNYRTYEMAYYVREELNKRGWDKSNLPGIVDDYPVWYTWLMNFYQYVNPRDGGWIVGITPKHSESGKLEHLYFRRLEDALWERDLMLKYDWDEELMIECADDSKNPYYDMELPPYPQRKVRRIAEREPRTELFNTLFELITDDPNLSQEVYAELAGTNPVTIRNVLKNEFDTDWVEFKRLCESGEHPNEVLEQKKIIYNPDLSIHYNNTNYVSYHKNEASPYIIYHRNKVTQQSEYFGAYPTRELADKISNDLQKCDWDKSKLKEIQAKYGWQSVVNSKRWISEQKHTLKDGTVKVYGYHLRKKDKTKKMINYGYYKDKRVAELVRDLCVKYDWNLDFLQRIQDYAYYCISEVDRYENYKSY